MPVHNQLHRGVFSDALKAAVGDSKSEAGLERYGETLTPIIDLWGRAEFAFLRKEYPWQISRTETATVGEFSGLAISNANNSKALVIVEEVAVSGATATFELFPVTRTQLATFTQIATGAQNRDLRAVNRLPLAFDAPVPFVELWAGSDAASLLTAGTRFDKQFCASTSVVSKFTGGPFILKPGTGIVVQCTTVNLGLDVTWVGYTRGALPGELLA